MGKMNSQPEPTVQHFSHPHTLHLSNHQPQQTLNLALCSCCKLSVSGLIYTCQLCNYYLHVKCSQMPQQIKHPFDQNHVFSLLPTPIYPEGIFSCDACGKQGNGFSYHCKACSIDLHVLCALMLLSTTHQSHHHQLNLTFSPPYHNQSFSCDICKNIGSNHWLYRCNLCEFDAHLICATTRPTVPAQAQPFQMLQYQHGSTVPVRVQVQAPPMQPIQMQQFQTTASRVGPQFQVFRPQYAVTPPLQNYPQNNFVNVGNPYGSVAPLVNRQNNDLISQAIQSFIGGGSESAGQQLMQGLLGGSGGSGGGSGGGSNGGNETFQFLEGIIGSGGNGNVLQALIGGGGGGDSGNNGGILDVFGGNGVAFDGSGVNFGALGDFQNNL
ncbi:unnamed protein product [Camellia sinensis]